MQRHTSRACSMRRCSSAGRHGAHHGAYARICGALGQGRKHMRLRCPPHASPPRPCQRVVRHCRQGLSLCSALQCVHHRGGGRRACSQGAVRQARRLQALRSRPGAVCSRSGGGLSPRAFCAPTMPRWRLASALTLWAQTCCPALQRLPPILLQATGAAAAQLPPGVSASLDADDRSGGGAEQPLARSGSDQQLQASAAAAHDAGGSVLSPGASSVCSAEPPAELAATEHALDAGSAAPPRVLSQRERAWAAQGLEAGAGPGAAAAAAAATSEATERGHLPAVEHVVARGMLSAEASSRQLAGLPDIVGVSFQVSHGSGSFEAVVRALEVTGRRAAACRSSGASSSSDSNCGSADGGATASGDAATAAAGAAADEPADSGRVQAGDCVERLSDGGFWGTPVANGVRSSSSACDGRTTANATCSLRGAAGLVAPDGVLEQPPVALPGLAAGGGGGAAAQVVAAAVRMATPETEQPCSSPSDPSAETMARCASSSQPAAEAAEHGSIVGAEQATTPTCTAAAEVMPLAEGAPATRAEDFWGSAVKPSRGAGIPTGNSAALGAQAAAEQPVAARALGPQLAGVSTVEPGGAAAGARSLFSALAAETAGRAGRVSWASVTVVPLPDALPVPAGAAATAGSSAGSSRRMSRVSSRGMSVLSPRGSAAWAADPAGAPAPAPHLAHAASLAHGGRAGRSSLGAAEGGGFLRAMPDQDPPSRSTSLAVPSGGATAFASARGEAALVPLASSGLLGRRASRTLSGESRAHRGMNAAWWL